MKKGDADRQFESSWPGAARVQKEHPIPLHCGWLMGMPADDNAKPCCDRVQVKAVEVMEKIKHASSDLNCLGFGQIPGPIFPVHVSPDQIKRSNCPQGGENLRGAHITCMENEFNAPQGPESLGSNQAVGVGYDSCQVRSG
jgi:hypothetical protein